MPENNTKYDIIKIVAIAITGISASLYFIGQMFFSSFYVNEGIPRYFIPTLTIEEYMFYGARVTAETIPFGVVGYAIMWLVNKATNNRLLLFIWSHPLHSTVIILCLALYGVPLALSGLMSRSSLIDYGITPEVDYVVFKGEKSVSNKYKGFYLLGQKGKFYIFVGGKYQINSDDSMYKELVGTNRIFFLNSDDVNEIVLVRPGTREYIQSRRRARAISRKELEQEPNGARLD